MTALRRGSAEAAAAPAGLAQHTAYGRINAWLDRLFLVIPGPLLEGERVYLRPPRLSDWRAWADLRAESRGFLTPWEPTWPSDALSRSAYRRRLRHYGRDARAERGFAFFLFTRDGDRLAGGVTLSNVRRGVTQSCSTGYWIGEPWARRGLMGDGLRALVPWVFQELGLHRLEAACLPSNEPSQRLLRSLGFHEEGYARDYLRINGAWRDHVLFALLKDDLDPATDPPVRRDRPASTTGSDRSRAV